MVQFQKFNKKIILETPQLGETHCIIIIINILFDSLLNIYLIILLIERVRVKHSHTRIIIITIMLPGVERCLA